MAVPKGKKEVRCCIDLGSSYVRLLVVSGVFDRRGAAEPRVVEQRRAFLGWGDDLVRGRIVTRRSAAAASVILADFVRRSRELGCARPLILATNTLRAAANRGHVVRTLERGAGVPVRVLSGRGEAALGFAGAVSLLPPARPALLIDPGGTSTEIAWGNAPRAEGWRSFPCGTHTVNHKLRRFGSRAPRAGRRRVVLSLRETLAPQCAAAVDWAADSCLSFGGDGPTIMVTGGTAVALAAVDRFIRRAEPLRFEHELFAPVDVALVGARIWRACSVGGEAKYPLEPERRRLLLAGLVLIEALAGVLGARRATVVARDLRWGGLLIGEDMPEGYLADE